MTSTGSISLCNTDQRLITNKCTLHNSPVKINILTLSQSDLPGDTSQLLLQWPPNKRNRWAYQMLCDPTASEGTEQYGEFAGGITVRFTSDQFQAHAQSTRSRTALTY
jgi:hypothetical protein